MPTDPSALGVFPQLRLVPAAERARTMPAVRRPHPARIALQMWARAGWIALQEYRHPIRAWRALKRVRAAGRTHEWSAPTGAPARPWTLPKFASVAGRHYWHLHAPGWPSPAFDGFVRRELARAEAPVHPATLNTAIIAITKRCALQCEHCFEWEALNQPEALSASDLQEIVRRVHARGVSQVFFSGGEPLQRFEDLIALSRSIAADTDVWILSSGLGLTADKARRLRDAGVTGVALSLDHWHAAAHDRFRGFPGSADAVARAARHATDAGLVVALSLCPTRAFVSRENLDRYAARAHELGAAFIQILEPKAVGHYAEQDVALTRAQEQLLEDFCRRLNTDPDARHLPAVSYVDWSTRALGCVGAGDRYLYVDTSGELHACPFCRTPGVRLLDHDFAAAIARLQTTGCPAAGGCACDPGEPVGHLARTFP